MQRKGIVRSTYMSTKDIAAADKYVDRGFVLVRDDWMSWASDPPTWEPEFFGDVDAMVISFRRDPEDAGAGLGVAHRDGRWRIVGE